MENAVEHGMAHEQREGFIRTELAEGFPGHRGYTPEEALMEDCEAWKKTWQMATVKDRSV